MSWTSDVDKEIMRMGAEQEDELRKSDAYAGFDGGNKAGKNEMARYAARKEAEIRRFIDENKLGEPNWNDK